MNSNILSNPIKIMAQEKNWYQITIDNWAQITVLLGMISFIIVTLGLGTK